MARSKLAAVADTAGQWHALNHCYGQPRRPVARSDCLLWPTPQDAEGVTLDTNVDWGGVGGVASLDPSLPKETGYFLPLITYLESLGGYTRGQNLHGIPYDWRYPTFLVSRTLLFSHSYPTCW